MGRPDAEHPPAPRQPSPAELEHAAGVLQLLADRTRLGILALLTTGGEPSVGQTAAHLQRPVPAASQPPAKLQAGPPRR